MKFKHVIFTRFNLQYDLESDLYIQTAWLDERFRLFEQYCLPSIVRQTSLHFTWVILSSNQTPDWYKNRLSNYAQRYQNIQIEYCAYYEDVNVLYKALGEKYVEDNDFLLSTRIDSDDMLAVDFVSTLQSYVQSYLSNEAVISFTNGVQWFEKDNIVFAASYSQNHFLNFLECRHHIRTCLGMDHTKVSEKALVQLNHIAMWCEIVHGNNICNGYTPAYRYSTPIISEGSYPIHLPVSNTIRQYMFLMREHIRFRYHQIGRGLRKLVGHRIS